MRDASVSSAGVKRREQPCGFSTSGSRGALSPMKRKANVDEASPSIRPTNTRQDDASSEPAKANVAGAGQTSTRTCRSSERTCRSMLQSTISSSAQIRTGWSGGTCPSASAMLVSERRPRCVKRLSGGFESAMVLIPTPGISFGFPGLPPSVCVPVGTMPHPVCGCARSGGRPCRTFPESRRRPSARRPEQNSEAN